MTTLLLDGFVRLAVLAAVVYILCGVFFSRGRFWLHIVADVVVSIFLWRHFANALDPTSGAIVGIGAFFTFLAFLAGSLGKLRR